MRTTDTLKKLWGKLKSEAKTYKASSRKSVTGTGGGPPKKFDDPVLELVVEMTGRGSTGIVNVDDCDAVEVTMLENTNENASASAMSEEYLDESIFLDDFPEDKERKMDFPEDTTTEEGGKQEAAVDVLKNLKPTKENDPNRRRPDLNVANERTGKIQRQQRISNRFAAERLRAEQAKTELIRNQISQYAELHCIKMENERLKKEILENLFKKVKEANTKDAEKAATQFILDLDKL